MSVSAFDVSVAVFVRGLTNLRGQLVRAAGQGGGDTLLQARPHGVAANAAAGDLHAYPLCAHVHWAAEGALLALAQVRGVERTRQVTPATTFAELDRRLAEAIEQLAAVDPNDLERALDREVQHPRAASKTTGRQFVLAFAVPHFFFHLTAAYGLMRQQGVPLTMGDFLGDWAA